MGEAANAASGTKERILDAAEALFAESGFAATSLRALTGQAGVNLAAVHYHFGSKEALLAAVLERRVAPVNRERLLRLDTLEKHDSEPGVEAILRAFLAPAIAMYGKSGIRPILARLHSEPIELVRVILERQFGELARRFVAALARALPDISSDEVGERFELVVGAMLHIIGGSRETSVLGTPVASDRETLERMVAFLAAGMSVPLEAANPVRTGGPRS